MAPHGTLPVRGPTDFAPSRLTPAAPPGRRLRTFRALRHRNYRLFFLGQMVSVVGSWVQITALMWLAFHLTATSSWPALVAAAQLLPGVLLGAWGGGLADHWPRRTLLFWTQAALLALALLLAGLVCAGLANVWHLLLIATANGIVNAVDLPARLAFLSEMVAADDLVNAVGLNSLLFNVARAAGPALGGWLLLRWGAATCFLVNALSYLAVLAALARMDVAPRLATGDRRGRDLLAGFRHVFGHPSLRLLLPLTGAMALFGWPLLALLPALARHRLGTGGGGYSSLLSAVGAGALTAALLVASFGSMRRRRLFLGAGVVVASVALVGLSLAPGLAEARCCCGLAGCGLILFFATSQSVFQLSAGEHNRGRVLGIYTVVLSGAIPLGNLLTGPAADCWGEPLVLRLQGGAMLAVAAAVLLIARLLGRGNVSAPGDHAPG